MLRESRSRRTNEFDKVNTLNVRQSSLAAVTFVHCLIVKIATAQEITQDMTAHIDAWHGRVEFSFNACMCQVRTYIAAKVPRKHRDMIKYTKQLRTIRNEQRDAKNSPSSWYDTYRCFIENVAVAVCVKLRLRG